LAQYLLCEDPATFGVEVCELTIAEVCLSYVKYAKSYYGSDSQEYKNILMAVRPVSELIPRKLAKDFGPLDFKQIRQWWLNRDVSRQYANKQMSRVVRAVKWLVSEGILPPAIYQAIKCVSPLTKGHCKAREATPVAPVSDVKVNATLPHLSRVVADMVRFQRLTGCRPGEVCSLTPSMVDRSNSVWERCSEICGSLARHKRICDSYLSLHESQNDLCLANESQKPLKWRAREQAEERGPR
jgi:integrase